MNEGEKESEPGSGGRVWLQFVDISPIGRRSF